MIDDSSMLLIHAIPVDRDDFNFPPPYKFDHHSWTVCNCTVVFTLQWQIFSHSDTYYNSVEFISFLNFIYSSKLLRVWCLQNNREKKVNFFFSFTRYTELIQNIPTRLRSAWYYNTILNKLCKYGLVSAILPFSTCGASFRSACG